MATFQEIYVVMFSWVVLFLSSSGSVSVSGFSIVSTTPTEMVVVVSSTLQQQQQQHQRRQQHFRQISTTRYEEKSRNSKKKKKRKNHLIILHATENNNDHDGSSGGDGGGGGGKNDDNKVETLKDQRAEMSAKISNDRIEFPPNILQPFPDAADPSYATTAPVGEGQFVVSRGVGGDGGPTAEELTNENILLIVERRSNVTDLEVNTLVWKCLGYRFYPSSDGGGGGEWRPDEVFPNWKERFPEPPDLIGMQRIYSKEIDSTSLKNNQHLVRSVPDEFKQSLKGNLKPLGFTGYKVSELTPNLTRRAQCANWLLYYRDELFGYTLDELKERRERKKKEEQQRQQQEQQSTSSQEHSPSDEDTKTQDRQEQQKDWKPPVKEVF